MSEESKRKFADLNMTKDELDRFSEAMKKEEFRKLLVEYAEELADPKNREQYEKEITQLEEERGMNVTFIHPDKGFCLKTTQNSDTKCFINICKNDKIDKPTSKAQEHNQKGKKTTGLFWEIPHTCSPAREDHDHEKKRCIVYDVVFHPDSYRMGETNDRFKNLLKDSAMDTIERSYNVKLDRVNAKVLKNIAFKGRPTACVIKKKVENFCQNDSADPLKPLFDQIREHNLDKELDDRLNKIDNTIGKKLDDLKDMNNNISNKNETESKPTHTVPKYSIVHRGIPEMSDHANQLDSNVINSTRPKEISVSIELPLLKSSQNVNLDVYKTTLELSHESPNYELNIKLPFPVREMEAKAKFDKSKRILNVTLPVIAFVGKIESAPEYTFPLSCESSNSNSLNSISDVATVLDSKPNLSNDSKSTEDSSDKENLRPVMNNDDSKYKLPQKILISETKGFISFKFSIKNYVKDSIKITFNSPSAFSFTCESCSSSGCYVQYYSSFVKLNSPLIDSELASELSSPCSFSDINNGTVSFIFNSDSQFEIKLKKGSKFALDIKTASVSINSSEINSEIVNIEQDTTEEKIEETLISESKVNNMSRKDYIMNFKEIISEKGVDSGEKLDEDDDDEDGDDNEEEKIERGETMMKKNAKNLINHEKAKFEQRKLSKKNPDIISKKIEEEPELEEKVEKSDQEVSDYEKDYLQSQLNCHNYETNEENDEADECDLKNNERSSSSSFSTNDSSILGSSVNSNSSCQLKSILKKPRSYSESESSHTSFKNAMLEKSSMKQTKLGNSLDSTEMEENHSNSEDNLNNSKKSVHFNNQVVRNVFKSNSTVQGMKKPNSLKNKKKNQRKRTISDPSSDSNYSNLIDGKSSNNFRSRSISESSDDIGNATPQSANSCDSLTEESNKTNEEQNTKKTKKKNKKKSKKNNKKLDETPEKSQFSKNDSQETKEFDVETMLQWKNQGLLPSDENFSYKSECSFKFKNKILNDLDD